MHNYCKLRSHNKPINWLNLLYSNSQSITVDRKSTNQVFRPVLWPPQHKQTSSLKQHKQMKFLSMQSSSEGGPNPRLESLGISKSLLTRKVTTPQNSLNKIDATRSWAMSPSASSRNSFSRNHSRRRNRLRGRQSRTLRGRLLGRQLSTLRLDCRECPMRTWLKLMCSLELSMSRLIRSSQRMRWWQQLKSLSMIRHKKLLSRPNLIHQLEMFRLLNKESRSRSSKQWHRNNQKLS